jgi:hypothetical protein
MFGVPIRIKRPVDTSTAPKRSGTFAESSWAARGATASARAVPRRRIATQAVRNGNFDDTAKWPIAIHP